MNKIKFLKHPITLSRREFFVLLFLTVVIFQVASVYAPHTEGDEQVFLRLSKNMGWNLSNYTVMNDTPYNKFPNRLYRQTVFIHPPLFPLILKVGTMFVNPILFGVIFNGLLKFILVVVMLHFALTLGAGESAARLVAVFVTACPIIGFVGSRILLDMIFTVSLIVVIFLLIKAGIENTQKNLFLATIFCCIFLNTKIQAIVYMPLFAFLYGTAVKRAFEKEELTYETFRLQLLAVLLFVGFLGFSHYFRMIFSLGFNECLHLLDIEQPLNPFIQRISTRSPFKFFIYLTLIHPVIYLLIRPSILTEIGKRLKSARSPFSLVIISLLFSISVTFLLCGAQERYWAHVFPIVFLVVVFLYETICNDIEKKCAFVTYVYAPYFILIFMNNFQINVLLAGSRTAMVSPALLELLPFLRMSYGPFYNF